MATYRQIKRDCEKRNRANRQIIQSNSINIDKFWKYTDGNFFVSGGDESERNRILISKLFQLSRDSYAPIIVFNNSLSFEDRIIELAEDHQIGPLIIASERYRNYDVFLGMPFPKIAEFLQNIAREMNYHNSGRVSTYALALCNLINSIEDEIVNLDSLIRFTNLGDDIIEREARRRGLNIRDLNVLSNGAEECESMRSVLKVVKASMACISTGKVRRGYNLYNYSSFTKDPFAIIVIDTNSVTPTVFNEYFAMEIEVAIQQIRGASVIFNNSYLTDRDRLGIMIQRYKEQSTVNIGIVNQNLASWVHNTTLNNGVLTNFQSCILLYTGIEDSADLDEILQRFGEYDYYEPIMDGGRSNMFDILTSYQYRSAFIERRARVRTMDLAEYGVVAKGHLRNQVEIARGIKSKW